MTRQLSHVLLVWELGGNLGHLMRMQQVAQRLGALGVRCTWVVLDMAQAQPWLAARGLQAVQAPDPGAAWRAQAPQHAGAHGHDIRCHADWLWRAGFGQAGVAKRLVQEWQALWQQLQPDAALLDFAPSAAYALQTLGKAYVHMSVGFCTPSSAQVADCFQPWDRAAQQQAQRSHEALLQRLDELGQELAAELSAEMGAEMGAEIGQRAPRHLLQMYPQARMAYCTFGAMDHFSERSYKPNYLGAIWGEAHRTNAPPATAQTPSLWPHGSEGARVFAYLNHGAEQVMPWLALLSQSKLEVLAIAPKLPAEQMEQLSHAHMRVQREPVDMQAAFTGCNACITHGGQGLTAASLWHGVPLLLLPRQAEQALLARRLTMGGLATSTVQPPSAALLQAKLGELLHQGQIRSHVQAFAKAHAALTPAHAVDGILQQLCAIEGFECV
jgi:hypothetical protein